MASVHLDTVGYQDEFCQEITSARPLVLDDVIEASRQWDFPAYVRVLFRIRDSLVGWFGIKTLKNHHPTGESFGIFSILQRNANEVIAGEDDRHLNFRVVIRLNLVDGNVYRISFTTLVEFKNIFGRIYFLPVKPFHKIIVPHLLRRLAKKVSHYKT